MILQPTVNITSDPAGGLMGKNTTMGIHWRKLSRTQLKAMNEDYWRDRPKRSPKNSHADLVGFHLSSWSFWANKPFRTMTLKSSCAALKWIGTSVTPQQGMQCDHHLWWMDSHLFKHDIEPHGGTEACKIKRNVPKPKFQNGGICWIWYSGKDWQGIMNAITMISVFCCPNGSSHLKMRFDSMKSFCLHSWQQCDVPCLECPSKTSHCRYTIHYSLFWMGQHEIWHLDIFLLSSLFWIISQHISRNNLKTHFPSILGLNILPMKLHHELAFFSKIPSKIHQWKKNSHQWMKTSHPCVVVSKIFYFQRGWFNHQPDPIRFFVLPNETPHWTVSPFRLDLPFRSLVLHLRGTRKWCSWRCPDAVGSDATSWKRRL